MFLRRLDFELDKKLSDIQELADAMDTFAKFSLIPQNILFRINLAIDELVTNTINYGSSGGIEPKIDVIVERFGQQLHIEIRDNLTPFDPLSLPTPDLDAGIDERRVGGLGIHFVRTLIDQVEYKHDGTYNVIRLTVPLRRPADGEASAQRETVARSA